MFHLDQVYTPDDKRYLPQKDQPVAEWFLDDSGEPLEMLTRHPWEQSVTETLSSVYWVRDEAGRILAVAMHQPGADPEHPDLVVFYQGQVYQYRCEKTPESYRARLYALTRLPQAVASSRN